MNYQLSKKHKLLGNGEFNYLTIILTLPSRVRLNSNLITRAQNVGTF